MARKSSKTNNNYAGAGVGATAGGVGGTLLGAGVASGISSAGGTTVTTCPPEDKSFYCQFVKGFNIFKMILFIIGILIVIYIVYLIFFSTKKFKF
jgi:hypothetical protein